MSPLQAAKRAVMSAERSDYVPWEAITRFGLGLVAIAVSALIGSHIALLGRVTTIEASRFTARDAYAFKTEMVSALQSIRDVVAEMPSDDFEARVLRLEAATSAVQLHLAREDGYRVESSGGTR